MPEELTLEVLDDLIKQTEDEIVGFVVSPEDARAIDQKTKAIYGIDSHKMFISPPYTGIPIYISEMVASGHPIRLTKQNTLQLKEPS